jgi:hypothetical protein
MRSEGLTIPPTLSERCPKHKLRFDDNPAVVLFSFGYASASAALTGAARNRVATHAA